MQKSLLPILLLVLLGACKVNKNNSSANDGKTRHIKEVLVRTARTVKPMEYQPSETKIHELQHTWLNLSFDYKKQYVMGKALLTLQPHFYATDSVQLDAKKMLLHRVAMVSGRDTTNLQYRYDEEVIHIYLGKKYTAGERFYIYVDYTARPNETTRKGSAAITDAKGLYFINPTGEDGNKPRQIWTQGETQSNSCWFPTLDVPNQKMTQDLFLRVDQKDITLSNGELVLSKDHADGTRTDHWKQTLPHAPYLTMIVVGEFAVVKDYWRDNMEVNYYVEPAYKPYAKLIFGNTPEMLELFSRKLGVDYPWEKFSQIVVRDFVSGAMENTSAVIHFEPLQHDARAHLDNTYEDVVSHELFHHWFGDLVTCESWSNIPLNESFATYGEYIWNEHKYGRLHADHLLEEKLNAYLSNGNNSDRTPIRYKYKNREDMFDAVSYQKGGRMLHMLRYAVGDSAFYRSLQVYLTAHKFGTAEIHDLRLAFEQVTGQDLNWFFNQWFMQAGHPKVVFNYKKSTDGKKVQLTVQQHQDKDKYGIYRLPLDVDIYSGGKVKRESIVVSNIADSFTFESEHSIDLLNPDAERVLVAEITDNKSKSELAFQFLHAPRYADKWYALKNYTGDTTIAPDSNLLVMADYALQHSYYGIRAMGLIILAGATPQQFKTYEFRLRQIGKFDSIASIRRDVIELLQNQDPQAFAALFEDRINDSSYQVSAAALVALNKANPKKAMHIASSLEKETNGELLSAVSTIYAQSGDSTKYPFFIPAIKKGGPYRFSLLQDFWEYTMMQMPATQLRCLDELRKFNETADTYERYINKQLALQMKSQHDGLQTELNLMLKKQKKDSEQARRIQLALEDIDRVNEKLEEFIR
ncbi:MAG: M1 family metallopeptidase [Bacteroidia bacterium]